MLLISLLIHFFFFLKSSAQTTLTNDFNSIGTDTTTTSELLAMGHRWRIQDQGNSNRRSNWLVDNGKLKQNQGSCDANYNSLLLTGGGGKGWSDYCVSIKIIPDNNGCSNFDFGIILRHVDERNYYRVSHRRESNTYKITLDKITSSSESRKVETTIGSGTSSKTLMACVAGKYISIFRGTTDVSTTPLLKFKDDTVISLVLVLLFVPFFLGATLNPILPSIYKRDGRRRRGLVKFYGFGSMVGNCLRKIGVTVVLVENMKQKSSAICLAVISFVTWIAMKPVTYITRRENRKKYYQTSSSSSLFVVVVASTCLYGVNSSCIAQQQSYFEDRGCHVANDQGTTVQELGTVTNMYSYAHCSITCSTTPDSHFIVTSVHMFQGTADELEVLHQMTRDHMFFLPSYNLLIDSHGRPQFPITNPGWVEDHFNAIHYGWQKQRLAAAQGAFGYYINREDPTMQPTTAGIEAGSVFQHLGIYLFNDMTIKASNIWSTAYPGAITPVAATPTPAPSTSSSTSSSASSSSAVPSLSQPDQCPILRSGQLRRHSDGTYAMRMICNFGKSRLIKIWWTKDKTQRRKTDPFIVIKVEACYGMDAVASGKLGHRSDINQYDHEVLPRPQNALMIVVDYVINHNPPQSIYEEDNDNGVLKLSHQEIAMQNAQQRIAELQYNYHRYRCYTLAEEKKEECLQLLQDGDTPTQHVTPFVIENFDTNAIIDWQTTDMVRTSIGFNPKQALGFYQKLHSMYLNYQRQGVVESKNKKLEHFIKANDCLFQHAPYTNGMTEQHMVNVARQIGPTLLRKSGDMNPAVSIMIGRRTLLEKTKMLAVNLQQSDRDILIDYGFESTGRKFYFAVKEKQARSEHLWIHNFPTGYTSTDPAIRPFIQKALKEEKYFQCLEKMEELLTEKIAYVGSKEQKNRHKNRKCWIEEKMMKQRKVDFQHFVCFNNQIDMRAAIAKCDRYRQLSRNPTNKNYVKKTYVTDGYSKDQYIDKIYFDRAFTKPTIGGLNLASGSRLQHSTNLSCKRFGTNWVDGDLWIYQRAPEEKKKGYKKRKRNSKTRVRITFGLLLKWKEGEDPAQSVLDRYFQSYQSKQIYSIPQYLRFCYNLVTCEIFTSSTFASSVQIHEVYWANKECQPIIKYGYDTLDDNDMDDMDEDDDEDEDEDENKVESNNDDDNNKKRPRKDDGLGY